MSNELHLKHRPKTLDEVIGHRDVCRSLRRVLDGKESRAFIFQGPAGCGKTTLARIIAREVGCDPKNITEVDAATHNGIDAMRDLTAMAQFSALGKSRAKVYIVDEAHQLSKAAWDSLLKNVEEPPPHVTWVFCTTLGGKIPQTIQSRCSLYTLKPVDKEGLYALLEKVCKAEQFDTDESILDLLSIKAEGSPRRALTMLALVRGCKDRKRAASMLQGMPDEAGEVVELCRALESGSWENCLEKAKALVDMNPESIRIVVTAYWTKVLLSAKDEKRARAICGILDAFARPYPTTANISAVLLSIGELTLAE